MATVIVGDIKTAFGGPGQGADSQLELQQPQQQQQQQQLLPYHRSGTPPGGICPASYMAFHHKSSPYIERESCIGVSSISQVSECGHPAIEYGHQAVQYTPVENDLDVRLYQMHYNDSSEHMLEPDQLAAGPNPHDQQAGFVATSPFGTPTAITTSATTTLTKKPTLDYDELEETNAQLHAVQPDEDYKTYHLLESDQQVSEAHGNHKHDYNNDHHHQQQQQQQQHYHQEVATPILAVAQHYELPAPDYYAHPYHVSGGVNGALPLAAHIAYDPQQYHLVDPNFAALGYDQPILSDQYDPAAELDSCLQQFNEYHGDENDACNQQDEGEQLEREDSGSGSFIESCFDDNEYCANRTNDETNWDHQYNNQHIQNQHQMINLDEHQGQQKQLQQRSNQEQEAQSISLLASNQDHRGVRREAPNSNGSGQSCKSNGERVASSGCRRETLERLRLFIENRMRPKTDSSSSGGEFIGGSIGTSSKVTVGRPSIFESPRSSWQPQAPREFQSRINRELESVSRVTSGQFEVDDGRARRRSPQQRRVSLADSHKINSISQQERPSANIAVIREPVLLNMLKGNETTSRHLDQYWTDQNLIQKGDHARSWGPRASQIASELEDTGVQTRASKRRRLQQQLEEQQQREQHSNQDKRLSSLGPSSSSCGSYSSVGVMTEEDEVGSETDSPPEQLQ